MRAQEFILEDTSEVSAQILIKVRKGRNKFATELFINGKPAGVYHYEANSGRSIAEVYPEYKGKGLGKILVLHAIYTAAKLGMDFVEDESRTAEYDNVLDSLDSNGLAVNDDGYWYVTGKGEQFLIQTLKQGLSEDNPDYDEDRYLKSDPGTPLNFPKGTTLVDVSDVYDWYKLGMAVSDLDDADPRTFNKGVPHTVFAFGSEEEEHKMIPLLKRLGFSLHDIDTPQDYAKAIRADEAIAHLEEMAGEIHGGIRKALMDKGYKYLGGGIDKQAYLEPNGQVYIVFGYRKGVEGFSPDQRMFINWINYCNKNKDNPHLPRFSGFETFEYQGKNYIQARMETLRELPDEVGYLVGNIEEVTMQMGRGNFDRAMKILTGYAQDSSYEGDQPLWYEIKDSINFLGGPEAAKNLLKTVKTVQQFARKHNYSIDLHRGNYMARPNGTIVVNDPFVIWERNL